MAGGGEWEPSADDWLRWARTPGHDAYWWFRDSFFDELLPEPSGPLLEVGCGEGRVARDLADRGHAVIGVDDAATLVCHARDADAASTYVVADGASLPFADAVFEVVVAYNSLQVVADLTTTISEAARVLRPGGRLCACVVHPFTDLAPFDGETVSVRPGYFESERVDDTVERNGLTMRFRGWTHSLEHYSRALEHAGLSIEAMREPRPRDDAPGYERARRAPMFLSLRAVKAQR